MMEKYFHATQYDNMEKIICEGIIQPGWDGMVYLCKTPEDACKFVAIRGEKHIGVFELTLPANEIKESLDHSEAFFQCKAFMYKGEIRRKQWVNTYEYEVSA